MANISAIQLPDGVTYDIKDDTSGFITGMTILSYGNSTWQDFLDAYNANKVVYCRASSNSNPASGSQTRLAFMAYVNNATNPTNVEFQYYRSVSTHTVSQQGDQVYVYKLDKTAGWSVTIREASVKVVAGTGLDGTYSNGTMTLTGPTKVSDLTNDSGFITGYTDEKLAVAEVTSGTIYYPIVGADTTSAATKFYDKTGITYIGTNGTANENNGNALLTLGNNIASTTANWKKGTIRLYGTTAYYTDLVSGNPTENETITFPNKSGVVALTNDSPQSMIIASQEWKNIKSNELVFSNNFNVVTVRGVIQSLDTNESQQTTVSLNLGYTTSGNNRAVQADSNGNLYVTQKDDNSDEKVKLTSQATSGTYPLIFGPTSITSNSTYQGYYNTGITVNPSTKTVTATTFVGALTGTASGNLTSSSTLDATKLSGTIPTSCYTDTKNTAGTTNKTGTKMFLIAATEQSANPTTYSNSNCYIGTDNCLYSGGVKVLTAHQTAVTSITTTAGTHTTKTSATGAVSMTIPTKTSHLTNDSGFISTAAQIICW